MLRHPVNWLDANYADRRVYATAKRKWRGVNTRFPCPTCKREGALSYRDKLAGYQCHQCADLEEGPL